MLFMKKNLIKGMAALCVCAAFASCSKDAGFETASNPAELAKIQYKDAFVKKYGAIDPNQSWDFTGHYGKATRAGEAAPVMVWNQKFYSESKKELVKGSDFKQYLRADYEEVKSKVLSESIEPVNFPYTYSKVNLRPAFSHGYKDRYNFYHLGAEYTYNNETVSTSLEVKVNAKYSTYYNKEVWYSYGTYVSGTENMNFGSWREINTLSWVNADNARWWVYAEPANSNESYTKNTVEKCKLITVASGRTYIAFDCDGDKNYSDLICWIQVLDYVTPPSPVAYGKRYMVEDLGRIGDFDFNDIVFDVIQLPDGSQTCYVRALGGTYNITIKVGNTTWSKEGSQINVDGELVAAEEDKMYNTLPPNGEWILAEFPVTGWDPTDNNVTVLVNTRGQDGQYYTNTIQFPENGDVPMMVAVSTDKLWMTEYVSIESVPASFINENIYEIPQE